MLLTSLLFVLFGSVVADDCQKRDFGNGGQVCVCNSTFCDTVPNPDPVAAPSYIIYTTNKAGLRLHKSSASFVKTSKISSQQILVKSNEQYQTIIGWGGAFTDSTGINIASLDQQAQEKLLESYFSKNGNEYSLCRVPIGGTDFSTRAYSYDDGPVDPQLNNFTLAPEDFEYKIPYIKKALNLTNNNLKFFASAWTAPKWMKTNGQYNGLLGFLKDNMYQAWADYFVKFLDNYSKQGITFWGITTGNEPSLALVPSKISTVGWTPGKVAKWIENNLGPTIRNSSYSNLKIMMLDDQRFFLPWFVRQALHNPAPRNYVDGIAVHWYQDQLFPPSLLTDTHNSFPDKFLLGTEACNGDKPFQQHVILGSWERGELYAADIIQDVSNWVTGWVDWNMALNPQGGPTYIGNYVDSPIIVNSTSGEFYKQPTFYALGHFSKFVPPGSVRLGSSSFSSNIPVAAFRRPDNGTAVVILNKGNAANVTLVDDVRGSSTITLTANSLSTVLYW